jgi:hypothetical protein
MHSPRLHIHRQANDVQGTHFCCFIGNYIQRLARSAENLRDKKIDLIGDGLDAALRIAVLDDSSLVAKRLATVRRFRSENVSQLMRCRRTRQSCPTKFRRRTRPTD